MKHKYIDIKNKTAIAWEKDNILWVTDKFVLLRINNYSDTHKYQIEKKIIPNKSIAYNKNEFVKQFIGKYKDPSYFNEPYS